MEPLLSEQKQSFIEDVLGKFKLMVLVNMSDILINHHLDKQIEWNQTVVLQRPVNAVSFTRLSSLNQWARLRNVDQFNSFSGHSGVSTTTTLTLNINNSKCPPN